MAGADGVKHLAKGAGDDARHLAIVVATVVAAACTATAAAAAAAGALCQQAALHGVRLASARLTEGKERGVVAGQGAVDQVPGGGVIHLLLTGTRTKRAVEGEGPGGLAPGLLQRHLPARLVHSYDGALARLALALAGRPASNGHSHAL